MLGKPTKPRVITVLLALQLVLDLSFGISERIADGDEALPGEFPFLASVQSNQIQVCGATFISTSVLMTGCQCLIKNYNVEWTYNNQILQDPEKIEVIAGSIFNDIAYYEEGSSRKAKALKVHPMCEKSGTLLAYDYGVIKTKDPFELISASGMIKIFPLLMADKESITKAILNPIGVKCRTVGWGALHEEGRPVTYSNKVDLVLKPLDWCRTAVTNLPRAFNDEIQTCTLSEAKNHTGVCEGDNGGPLLCRPKKWIIVGLLTGSASGKCGNYSIPALWARLDFGLDWILRAFPLDPTTPDPMSFEPTSLPMPTPLFSRSLNKLKRSGTIDCRAVCGGWDGLERETVKRQLSVSSDSKLLDEDIHEETRVILRPKKPPRPKSEVFLNNKDNAQAKRRTKRFSAFGGDSPFGKSEAYIKLEQLGEGSYATVFKGFSNLTNQKVALKEIRLQEEEGAPFTAIREASLLKELKHCNIVTLHDIVHTRQTLTFVFEYVHTDLSQYMERHPGGLVYPNVLLLLFQLLRGLAYCHHRRVLHRDVKPQNLLISEIGELKLADFGLARAKSVPSHTYSHEVVTLWYRPPDVLLGSTTYSTSLDMWGVGCIFLEMITGFPTFPGVREVDDQLDKIFKILGTPTEETWEGVSSLPGYSNHLPYKGKKKLGLAFPRLYDIVEGENIATAFLQLDPDKRIGAEDALRHKYFSSLPKKLYELPDDVSIFTVEGVHLHPENRAPGIKS
ncbi:hypothetical protein GE061_003711 [Apolygus lucorum]|uniref:cyclin-dependent kinase n=1 Tax=Apolygus lucorum TaxID=248454 RepID=A0A8S9X2W4_APOLU|nr:hypothetical protein GE061_003711 [Apolygus lucorum]